MIGSQTSEIDESELSSSVKDKLQMV